MRNLPFKDFEHNQVWLWLVMLAQDIVAWTRQLCLADQARAWELKRLRYRLLHQSGRIARHARRTILRLSRHWPWAGQLAAAFERLKRSHPQHAGRGAAGRRHPTANRPAPRASACPQTAGQPQSE